MAVCNESPQRLQNRRVGGLLSPHIPQIRSSGWGLRVGGDGTVGAVRRGRTGAWGCTCRGCGLRAPEPGPGRFGAGGRGSGVARGGGVTRAAAARWPGSAPGGLVSVPGGLVSVPGGVVSVPGGVEPGTAGLATGPPGFAAVPAGLSPVTAGVNPETAGLNPVAAGFGAVPAGLGAVPTDSAEAAGAGFGAAGPGMATGSGRTELRGLPGNSSATPASGRTPDSSPGGGSPGGGCPGGCVCSDAVCSFSPLHSRNSPQEPQKVSPSALWPPQVRQTITRSPPRLGRYATPTLGALPVASVAIFAPVA